MIEKDFYLIDTKKTCLCTSALRSNVKIEYCDVPNCFWNKVNFPNFKPNDIVKLWIFLDRPFEIIFMQALYKSTLLRSYYTGDNRIDLNSFANVYEFINLLFNEMGQYLDLSLNSKTTNDALEKHNLYYENIYFKISKQFNMTKTQFLEDINPLFNYNYVHNCILRNCKNCNYNLNYIPILKNIVQYLPKLTFLKIKTL
jgi:hypothetical protein